jgi:hypothetical protein
MSQDVAEGKTQEDRNAKQVSLDSGFEYAFTYCMTNGIHMRTATRYKFATFAYLYGSNNRVRQIDVDTYKFTTFANLYGLTYYEGSSDTYKFASFAYVCTVAFTLISSDSEICGFHNSSSLGRMIKSILCISPWIIFWMQ